MARLGNDSRTSLLDAAEKLFAVHGVETTSLRDISAAAGQRNNSAVQYHFRNREGLVAAIFTRRMDEINVRRLEMLSDIDASHQSDDLIVLAEALMFPLIEYVTTHEGWYGRFLLRTQSDQYAKKIKNSVPASLPVIEIARRLTRAQTNLPARVRHARTEQLMTHYISAVADWEWARDLKQRRLSPTELFEDVLATGCAILLAPESVRSSTQRKLMK